jgi:hypothetical protein
LLELLRSACTAAGLWDEFASDWFCFDCELMPWSAKAQELLKNQYASVGSAGRAGLTAAIDLLEQTVPRLQDSQDGGLQELLHRYRQRHQKIVDYIAAYRGYCWPVKSVNDMKLAPFHLLVQPAVKCRGPEYLRIIYGPEYDAPENIARLRARSVGAKRALAIREFALGIEALERFVRREPLRRVHECVFGVLAMESEPVDARL